MPRLIEIGERKLLKTRDPLPCIFPSWVLLPQLGVEPAEIVNNAVAIDYILDLTSGVTGRIVELLRQSARLALGRETEKMSVEDLQHAGKFFAADIGSERNVSH